MENKIKKVMKRDGTTVDFDPKKIITAIHKAAGAVGIHDKELCKKITDEVVEILDKKSCDIDTTPPTVEEIQDIVEERLILNDYVAISKSYILYRAHRARQRQSKEDKVYRYDVIPYKKIWEILNWNVDHECETIEKLNKHIENKTIGNLIQEAEKAYHEDVEWAAKAILERKDKLRLVVIAGPSSSGKTTTMMKVAEFLKKEGINLIALNIDNYFFDLEHQPKDEFGDYDFETPEALDLPLINQHLSDLMQYKPIQMPQYDFKTGRRSAETTKFEIENNTIILIDTLHGLYEPMTKSVPQDSKFKLYIETLSQLKDENKQFTRWTDIRLLRRMTRDQLRRAYNPKMTIEHWHYVRRSELKHIIPYIPEVDYIINGSLIYELPVLKKYMFKHFPNFLEEYKDNLARKDAYIRSKRVYELLGALKTIENDDELVPANSLLREFIGGSAYDYHI